MKQYVRQRFHGVRNHDNRRVNDAAANLHRKLSRVDPAKLDVSDYTARYLGNILKNPIGKLQRYAELLSLCLENATLPIHRLGFVDYGGGTGMLALLAKELGIGSVIYNDIYDVSCRDAKILADAIGIPSDAYVCGDINDLISYVNKNNFEIQIVCSYDVIEHIYCLDDYIKSLKNISEKSFVVVFASSANGNNPVIRRRLQRIHRNREYKDLARTWGHKERDSLKGYLNIRRTIIRDHAPFLGDAMIDELAKKTRGLKKQDIITVINEYQLKSKIIYNPDHPSNTCDPYTGNWAERILEKSSLEIIFNKNKFRVNFIGGYWTYYENMCKRMSAKILNLCINQLPRSSLHLSPYYVIYAKSTADQNEYGI